MMDGYDDPVCCTFQPIYGQNDGDPVIRSDSPITSNDIPWRMVAKYKLGMSLSDAYVAWVLHRITVSFTAMEAFYATLDAISKSDPVVYLAKPSGLNEPQALMDAFLSAPGRRRLYRFSATYSPADEPPDYVSIIEYWYSL